MLPQKKIRKLPPTFAPTNTGRGTRTKSVEATSSDGKQLGQAFAGESVGEDGVAAAAAAEAKALDNARRETIAATRSAREKKVADALAMAQAQARAMAATAQRQAAVTATVAEVQEVLQQSVPKVEVRLPGGVGFYTVNGARVKMPVGYHHVNGYVYGEQVNVGGDIQFPYTDFYLDSRGMQYNTTVPPLFECNWGPCKRKHHWSIHCPHVDERNSHLKIPGLSVYVTTNK